MAIIFISGRGEDYLEVTCDGAEGARLGECFGVCDCGESGKGDEEYYVCRLLKFYDRESTKQILVFIAFENLFPNLEEKRRERG